MLQNVVFCFALLTSHAHGLGIYNAQQRVVPNPNGTTIQSIPDGEVSAGDMRNGTIDQFSVPIFVHKSADLISDAILLKGGWDIAHVKQICDTFTQHGGKGNVLDVGANIGSYTLPLAACLKQNGAGGNRIISIEGAPWNTKLLRASMKYNSFDNVVLYEYALTSPEGADSVDMYHHEGNEGMSHTKVGLMERVPATTFDAVAQSEGGSLNNIFLMKIDIEGNELNAFKGAAEFFKNGPCMIFIEMKYAEKDLTKVLQDVGYVVHPTGDGDANAWCERADLEACIVKLS